MVADIVLFKDEKEENIKYAMWSVTVMSIRSLPSFGGADIWRGCYEYLRGPCSTFHHKCQCNVTSICSSIL